MFTPMLNTIYIVLKVQIIAILALQLDFWEKPLLMREEVEEET